MIQNIFNIILLYFTYKFYIYTQNKIGSFIINNDEEIYDLLLNSKFIMIINRYLYNHKELTKYLLILTSFMLDSGILFLIIYEIILNNNYQVYLISVLGLLLRQMCQLINKLPKPKNMIWFNPKFPSLLVTYETTNDFFFSGHTYFSLTLGIYLLLNYGLFFQIYGIFMIFTEISFIIVTHSHYFMDIYASIVTYIMVHLIVKKYFDLF